MRNYAGPTRKGNSNKHKHFSQQENQNRTTALSLPPLMDPARLPVATLIVTLYTLVSTFATKMIDLNDLIMIIVLCCALLSIVQATRFLR